MKNETFNMVFFALMLIAYLFVAILDFSIFTKALIFLYALTEKMVPIVLFVFFLLFIINVFIKKERITKYLGTGKGAKGWIISIIAGLTSAGPIYAWYPLLRDLKEKGVSINFIAVFLYCKGVKFPLLPILIAYFGLVYTLVLTFVMIFAAVLQGLIISKIMD